MSCFKRIKLYQIQEKSVRGKQLHSVNLILYIATTYKFGTKYKVIKSNSLCYVIWLMIYLFLIFCLFFLEIIFGLMGIDDDTANLNGQWPDSRLVISPFSTSSSLNLVTKLNRPFDMQCWWRSVDPDWGGGNAALALTHCSCKNRSGKR